MRAIRSVGKMFASSSPSTYSSSLMFTSGSSPLNTFTVRFTAPVSGSRKRIALEPSLAISCSASWVSPQPSPWNAKLRSCRVSAASRTRARPSRQVSRKRLGPKRVTPSAKYALSSLCSESTAPRLDVEPAHARGAVAPTTLEQPALVDLEAFRETRSVVGQSEPASRRRARRGVRRTLGSRGRSACRSPPPAAARPSPPARTRGRRRGRPARRAASPRAAASRPSGAAPSGRLGSQLTRRGPRPRSAASSACFLALEARS